MNGTIVLNREPCEHREARGGYSETWDGLQTLNWPSTRNFRSQWSGPLRWTRTGGWTWIRGRPCLRSTRWSPKSKPQTPNPRPQTLESLDPKLLNSLNPVAGGAVSGGERDCDGGGGGIHGTRGGSSRTEEVQGQGRFPNHHQGVQHPFYCTVLSPIP